MTRTILLALCGILTACRPPAPVVEMDTSVEMQPAPEDVRAPALTREFRGVWLSPVWRPDWPSKPGLSPDSQRAELRTLLDHAQRAGLNTIVLHVRMAADAIYPTNLAPWSSLLTGTVGAAPEPAYDPLAFAIDEAHKRGLQLHAWFNPFRAAPPGRKQVPSSDHVASRHPDWVVSYGAQTWIDPGIPAARRHVLDAVLEVVDRYDIDGIHIDDYFYPYLEERNGRTIPFPDADTYKRYGSGFSSRGDWRRANIDTFVATLYREVKHRKSWLAVGISPFGIWRSGVPQGITGLNAYSEIFADSRQWLREGWLDYVAPQLYWPIGGAQSRFTRLEQWWHDENVRERHVYPGLHTDREVVGGKRWSQGEIVDQIDTLRALRAGTSAAMGHVHFRMKSVIALENTLRTAYTEQALPPAMPWLDARVPARPAVSTSANQGGAVLLRLAAGDTVPVRWYAVHILGDDGVWRLSMHRGNESLVLPVAASRLPKAVAVRALSPSGMESAESIVVRPN